MPNVRIGDGCVVGANSVVTRSLPNGVVAAGSPAKVLMTVEEFEERTKKVTKSGGGVYGSEFLRASITYDRMQQMREELDGGMGLIL